MVSIVPVCLLPAWWPPPVLHPVQWELCTCVPRSARLRLPMARSWHASGGCRTRLSSAVQDAGGTAAGTQGPATSAVVQLSAECQPGVNEQTSRVLGGNR